MILVLFAHPRPLRPTPSYTFTVYFMGVCLGIVSGVHRSAWQLHVPAATDALALVRSPADLLSPAMWGAAALRMLLGAFPSPAPGLQWPWPHATICCCRLRTPHATAAAACHRCCR